MAGRTGQRMNFPGAQSRRQEFVVEIGGVEVDAYEGQSLIELCDANIVPLRFSCRAGSCGTCMIRVLAGMENLSEKTGNEHVLLPELTDDPDARLACQVRLHGPIKMEPHED